MKVLELKDIQREEGQIFYRRKYTCNAVLELPTNTEVVPIFFIIDMDPLGRKSLEFSFPQPVNYPLLSVKKALTEFILAEDSEGRIPC